jgi:hypothetical protein
MIEVDQQGHEHDQPGSQPLPAPEERGRSARNREMENDME